MIPYIFPKHKYNSIRLGRYKPSSPVSCCARKKHGKEDNIFSQTCHFSDLCILCLRVGQWCHETVGEQICTGRPGACSIKLILHNLRPFCRKLRNFYNLWANLWSKFGRNNKSVIYGSQKFYGIGPRPTRMVQMDRNTFERFAIIYSTSLVPFFYRWHYGKRKTLVEIKKWSLSLKL